MRRTRAEPGNARRTIGALLAGLIVIIGAASASPRAAADQQDGPMRIVAFGDSLTAGYMLAPGDAFPVQLQRALAAKGIKVEIINGGVSGDTTAAAFERLDWSIPDAVDGVIVELGANDALRGLDPERARANLDRIVARLKAKGAVVLIAGMRAPRNLGEAYAGSFDAIFPDVARKHGALLYPFFLEGVALRAELNLGDGIHPNAAGVAEIVRGILPSVEAMIGEIRARRAATR